MSSDLKSALTALNTALTVLGALQYNVVPTYVYIQRFCDLQNAILDAERQWPEMIV